VIMFCGFWFLIWFVMCFRIHEHNVTDLILCALPYHDTHAFVRVVQILKIRLEIYWLSVTFFGCVVNCNGFWCIYWVLLRNGIWEFLKGVKDSGATLPRMVIVQQCLRDGGVLLKSLCDYVSKNTRVFSCEFDRCLR